MLLMLLWWAASKQWIWNDMNHECRFRKGRDVRVKSETFKRRICEVSMGGHQSAVLGTIHFWYVYVFFRKDRLTIHSTHGARSIIEFFLLTLWFHTIRRLAIPRSLLLQKLIIFYHFCSIFPMFSLNASHTCAMFESDTTRKMLTSPSSSRPFGIGTWVAHTARPDLWHATLAEAELSKRLLPQPWGLRHVWSFFGFRRHWNHQKSLKYIKIWWCP